MSGKERLQDQDRFFLSDLETSPVGKFRFITYGKGNALCFREHNRLDTGLLQGTKQSVYLFIMGSGQLYHPLGRSLSQIPYRDYLYASLP